MDAAVVRLLSHIWTLILQMPCDARYDAVRWRLVDIAKASVHRSAVRRAYTTDGSYCFANAVRRDDVLYEYEYHNQGDCWGGGGVVLFFCTREVFFFAHEKYADLYPPMIYCIYGPKNWEEY